MLFTYLINRTCIKKSLYVKKAQILLFYSDSFTIFGLWVLGLAVSHINESQLQTYESRTLFLMTSLQYYCILGLAEIKTLHLRDKIMHKRCRMRRSQNDCFYSSVRCWYFPLMTINGSLMAMHVLLAVQT